MVLALLVMSACSKFVEDLDVSPNDPGSVTPGLLLSNAELAIFASYQGQLARTANILTQSLAGTDFQMIEVAQYTLLEGDNVNEWEVIYADCIQSCNTLLKDFGDGNPYYSGMAKVLKAMALGLATDYWGDIPASDANRGLEGEYNPTYDKQEDVIKMIQSLLDDAIADFAMDVTANAVLPTVEDLIAGGDVDAWKKAAYMLKARYAIRLTKKGAVAAADAALAALTSAGLTGNADDFIAVYGVAGNELNPWDAFEKNRAGYIRMGGNLVDIMNGSSDPRLSKYAAKDTGGVYSGTPNGSTDNNSSPIGSYLRATGADLLTYVEAKFIEAEAQFRKGALQEAADAHNAAVKASVLKVVGAADTAFENAHASETSASITLEKIMTQKYVALFGQCEVWADWRRTDIPALTPNPQGNVNTIPRRLVTPLSERLYNANAQVVSSIESRVWWDE